MATFEPPPDLFRRQVESIRSQTLTDWVCVISDDCSDPAAFAELQRIVEGDARFVVSRSGRRRGFYHNFERALELVPAGARYVALADQDDVWGPDKLETLVREIGDARLIYSDQRIVTPGGDVVAATYWSRRANNHADMLSLLVANCVTGAASLFPRELLDDALPFPPAQFSHYHDHWIALTALALGEIRYVPRPLYDYVQHEHATIGHATATRMVRLRDRLSSLRLGARERVGRWRLHYFADACRLLQFATVLELRCGDRMSRPQAPRARPLPARRPLGAPHPRPVRARSARAGAPPARDTGRRVDARLRVHLAAADRRDRGRPPAAGRLDALPPPALRPGPRHRVPGDPDLRAIAEQLLPLRLAAADDAPERINLLVPALAAEPAPLHLARRLAERGARVRIVTVNPAGALARSWQATSACPGSRTRSRSSPGASRQGSRSAAPTPSWRRTGRPPMWLARLRRRRALPVPHRELRAAAAPAGTLAALATESYGFPHAALYSSELLREHFRRHGVGVYGEDDSAVYEDAVTAAAPRGGDAGALRAGRRALSRGAGDVRARRPRARPGAGARCVRWRLGRCMLSAPGGVAPARPRRRRVDAAPRRGLSARLRRRARSDARAASRPRAALHGRGRGCSR